MKKKFFNHGLEYAAPKHCLKYTTPFFSYVTVWGWAKKFLTAILEQVLDLSCLNNNQHFLKYARRTYKFICKKFPCYDGYCFAEKIHVKSLSLSLFLYISLNTQTHTVCLFSFFCFYFKGICVLFCLIFSYLSVSDLSSAG